jgi:hypothetical protein
MHVAACAPSSGSVRRHRRNDLSWHWVGLLGMLRRTAYFD